MLALTMGRWWHTRRVPTTGIKKNDQRTVEAWPRPGQRESYPRRERRLDEAVKRFKDCMIGLLVRGKKSPDGHPNAEVSSVLATRVLALSVVRKVPGCMIEDNKTMAEVRPRP
jgi:hypothetical protein